MSNKSGVSSQVISLPKGGGALQGIGEKFSPDLYTGTGNFTIPITLPQGRNGFQPQLSLVYSTGNGNSPFGLGWNISIPGIVRKTSHGIPRYDDRQDTFILSGSEDLVLVEQKPEFNQYRPRTEGIFANIRHYYGLNNQNNYWEVKSKDGLVSWYGAKTADQKLATIANPEKPEQIFAWNLTRTTDPFGNRIDYIYEKDNVNNDGVHHWSQLYLSEICYLDYGDQTNPKFLVKVKFIYENRPDPFSEYRAGFEIRTIRRCTKIKIFTNSEIETPVRTYNLSYLDSPTLLPYNNVSLLNQIIVEGHDNNLSEILPPLQFRYAQFEPEKRRFFPVKGAELPTNSLAQPDYELADLFGNGLPDIVEINDTVRYWRNLGNGQFARPRIMREAPAGMRLADAGVQLIDANGDGRIDLLVTKEGLSGYFSSRFGGSWDRKSFQRYEFAPSFNLEDPEVKLVDLTGDGVTDAIRSGTSFEYFFNHPKRGWIESRRVERKAITDFPNVNFSDTRVKWGDMSGDGLQDIILIHDGRIDYWPNLGYGNWGKRISMKNSPNYPYDYNPKRILVGDVDGDGLADIVYVDDRKVILWINQSGNGWSEPIEIKGTPPVSDMDAVRLVDLLGTGIAGILWSSQVSRQSDQSMFFLDFTGGVKPSLLQEMNNNMGAVTRVSYTSSIDSYLKDEKNPETRWRTHLPFPVQVVKQVEVIDQISQTKLTTQYDYHHGYWDGAEREFRGFGRVEQRDTEQLSQSDQANFNLEHSSNSVVPFSPPIETRNWFHQGPVGDEFGDWQALDLSHEYWSGDRTMLADYYFKAIFPQGLPRRAKRDALRTLRGSILRTEVYALDSSHWEHRPYTVTESLQGVQEVYPTDEEGSDRRRIFFPFAVANRTTQWERGDEPMTQCQFMGDYDSYGQLLSQISIAIPRGKDFLANIQTSHTPYLVTYQETVYAQRDDTQRYIVDRVASSTSYEIVNDGNIDIFSLRDSIFSGTAQRQLIGQSLNFYDRDPSAPEAGAFRGLPFKQIGDYGAVVRTENLVLTPDIISQAYKGGDTVLVPPYLRLSDFPAGTNVALYSNGARAIASSSFDGNNPPSVVINGDRKGSVWQVRVPSLEAYTATTSNLPDDYPTAFSALLPNLQTTDITRPQLITTPIGYGFAVGDAPFARGYFVATMRSRYDFHDAADGKGRGLLRATRDPLGRDTTITYDTYGFLPTAVTDPAGLTNRASYDYRVFQVKEASEPNGNQTAFSFTPLGLLRATWVKGNPSKVEGDRQRPSMRMEYDFLAFVRDRHPIFTRTIRHLHHDTDLDIALPQRDEIIETREYTDGFGRMIQTRSQGENVRFGDDIFGGGKTILPAKISDQQIGISGQENLDPNNPNVVVSGWQIYDNKGRVIEKYEPFFSQGWNYAPPKDSQLGQKSIMFYDPRGQVIHTVNPDGSEQRVIYGISNNLDDPQDFTPTPWEAYTYDVNDNAGRTHANESAAYRHHRNTPASIEIDALGRTVKLVARNRAKSSVIEEYITRSIYDIRGNLLKIIDPLEREACRQVYDLANQPLRIDSIDAGIKCSVLDAAGNIIEQRDSKGALILYAYDILNRPIRLWARDGANLPLTLREILVYGDNLADRNQARQANLLGKLYLHKDEAGVLTLENYDFKGNLLAKTRQAIADSAILSVFNTPPSNWEIPGFYVNWETGQEPALETAQYRTISTYDALNRIKTWQYPQDVEGNHKTLRPHYNRAGALEKVELDNTVYVDRIAYNAKGQRVLITYGNGIITRYAYNSQTFRLARLRTERYTKLSDWTYNLTGAPLQDFAYQYDLAGNMLKMEDRTPASGVLNNPEALQVADPELAQMLAAGNAMLRHFEYDPIYRLISATGRECDLPPEAPPWEDQPRGADLTRTRGYTERYQYDPMGNILQLQHQVDGIARNRNFTLASNNNRLNTVTVGQTVYRYIYDANGNLIQENESRHFTWDYSDRLRVFRNQTVGAAPTIYAQYLYDPSGQRVKKLVRKGANDYEVTVYIDGVFEHHRLVKPSETSENNTLQIMDDQKRIAMMRVGQPFPEDTSPPIQYHLGDHLSSSHVVIDSTGAWINREEYTPYGETSFGSFSKKRYRFTGKERDEESGLNYHGARYYSPWLARWTSCDPAGMVDGLNLYLYVQGNPVGFIDPQGLETESVGVEMKLNDVVSYDQKIEDRASLGQNVQKDHIIAQSKIELMRTSPDGTVHYNPKADPTVLVETGKATNSQPAKPHTQKTFHDPQSDVKEIQRLRTQGIKNFTDDIVEPSRQAALRSGYKPESVDKAIGGQLDNLFSSERMEEIGKQLKAKASDVDHVLSNVDEAFEDVGNASFRQKVAIPVGKVADVNVVKPFATKASKLVPFLGAGANLVAAGNEFRQGNYISGSLELVGLVPVVGDVVDAARLGVEAGTVVGEALDRKFQPGSGSVGNWYRTNVLNRF